MRLRTVFSITLLLCIAAGAQAGSRQAFLDRMQADRASDSGKLHTTLRALSRATTRGQEGMARSLPHLGIAHGAVTVSIVTKGSADAVKAQLQALGLANAKAMGSLVSGRLPIAALKAIAANPNVQSVRPSYVHTKAGLVTSQGDRAQRSNVARQRFTVDGRGVRVGILSDSFSCLTGPIFDGQMFTTRAQDVRNGDLPRDIKILDDTACPGGLDEGRAIGQIIHDVAPGASLSFHTAFNSEVDFAQGIIDLADAGSKVIVDDVGWFAEPMFQDGVIAQAVDTVHARGVAYFSSAGNDSRQSYESRWRDSGTYGISGRRHNFGTPGKKDGLQKVTLTDETDELVVLNWDQPFASTGGRGSASDVDFIAYLPNGDPVDPCDFDADGNLLTPVCQFAGVDSNRGGDAVEFMELVNFSGADAQVQLSIELYGGPTPGYLKYIYFDFGPGFFIPDEYDTQSGTVQGHPNAAGGEAVGAAGWYNTTAWNSPFHGATCKPACLELFSSAGGTPILFDKAGNRLPKPVVRAKPEVVGPDGGNSTFFYSPLATNVPGSTEVDNFPNFFGTSASAPHVAAIAALMMDKYRRAHGSNLAPDRIYKALEVTALDMSYSAGRLTDTFIFSNPKGFDYDSGFGFVDAVRALEQIN